MKFFRRIERHPKSPTQTRAEMWKEARDMAEMEHNAYKRFETTQGLLPAQFAGE